MNVMVRFVWGIESIFSQAPATRHRRQVSSHLHSPWHPRSTQPTSAASPPHCCPSSSFRSESICFLRGTPIPSIIHPHHHVARLIISIVPLLPSKLRDFYRPKPASRTTPLQRCTQESRLSEKHSVQSIAYSCDNDISLGAMPPLLQSSSNLAPLPGHPLALRSLLPLLHSLAPRLPSPDSALLPTRTLRPRSLASLFQRQTTVTANPIIPATYSGLGRGPTPGTIVGIVFGSVAGFLLILWLIYTCFNLGGNMRGSSSVIEEETVVRRRSRSPRRTSTRRSSPRRRSSPSSRSASEVIEIQSSRRERTPPRREPRRETVVIEETIRRARTPPPQDDIVEVIEEHSPSPRREKSERSRRVSGGFRTVDPEAFAGGSRPVRKVSRR